MNALVSFISNVVFSNLLVKVDILGRGCLSLIFPQDRHSFHWPHATHPMDRYSALVTKMAGIKNMQVVSRSIFQ